MSFFDKLRKNNKGGEEEEEKEPVEEPGETSEEETEEKSINVQEEKPKKRRKVKEEKSNRDNPENAGENTEKKEWFEAEGQLAVDVYQTSNELIIQSAVAGIKPEDLDVSTEKDVVTIKGRREKPAEDEERNYFYQECYWGPFSREIILPEEVDASRAEASMQNGILTIRMPKIDRDKKKKITIKTV